MAWAPPLTLDRAIEITGAICERSFHTLGLWDVGKPMASLEGVSLGQMVEAVALVNRENEKPSDGNGKTIHVIPDQRLVAAVFTLEHYEGTQRIASKPVKDGFAAVGVFVKEGQ